MCGVAPPERVQRGRSSILQAPRPIDPMCLGTRNWSLVGSGRGEHPDVRGPKLGAHQGRRDKPVAARRVMKNPAPLPPVGSVAVPRNVSNVHYLPRFGWTQVVEAPRDVTDLMDPDLLALIPLRLRVHRAWSPGPCDLRPVVDPLLNVARISTNRRYGLDKSSALGEHPAGSASALKRREMHAPTPSPPWLWRLHRHIAAALGGRRPMVTITNGRDRSETVERAAGPAGPRRYRIVWTGTLDRPPELRTFLKAVEAVVARRPALVDRLEVTFYGDVSDACRAIADRFVGDGPLGAVLRFPGFVPRRVALEALAHADAALIMLGTDPGIGLFVPGKLFDIIGQNQQVLAVLPRGDARDILEELGWGVIAEPEVADVERAIEHLFTLPPPTRLADPEGKYDRVGFAGRLADALREATEAAHCPHSARSGRPTASDVP